MGSNRESNQASLKDLKETGGAHAATDTHGHDHMFSAAPPPLEEYVADLTGSRHPKRVSCRGGAIKLSNVSGHTEWVATLNGGGVGNGLMVTVSALLMD